MRRPVETHAAAGPARPAWIAQPERSQAAVIRFYAWLAQTLGRPAARLLLYPISTYFLLFSTGARRASRTYLRKVLGREPRVSELFRHYHTFASTILDRVYFLRGDYGRFAIRAFNEDVARQATPAGGGCFLLGAHLGSFEAIRALGRQACGLNVAMVLYEDNGRKLNAVLDAIDPRFSLDVIPLGRVDSMLRVESALESGAFVGMLADRTIMGEDTVTCSFFGAPARIPVGPFRLAAMLKRPIVFMVGLYRGGNRYDIHFEPLADLREVDREHRAAAIEEAVQRYVERLEHYCRMAPYNWFNFYDYWA